MGSINLLEALMHIGNIAWQRRSPGNSPTLYPILFLADQPLTNFRRAYMGRLFPARRFLNKAFECRHFFIFSTSIFESELFYTFFVGFGDAAVGHRNWFFFSDVWFVFLEICPFFVQVLWGFFGERSTERRFVLGFARCFFFLFFRDVGEIILHFDEFLLVIWAFLKNSKLLKDPSCVFIFSELFNSSCNENRLVMLGI